MAIREFQPYPTDPTVQSGAGAFSHLPEVSVDIFSQHPQAAYMVALVAIGDEVIMPEAFDGYRQLRYEKYSALEWIKYDNYDQKDGAKLEKLDDHDKHSEHIAIIKNVRGSMPRIIATGRSIIKLSQDELLPVEKAYPDVFAPNPAPVRSNEVSRLISDSRNKPERALASMAVQRAITASCVRHDYGPTYAMIEEYLANRLNVTHFPHDVITDFRPIPEYADTQNAVMLTDWRRVLSETRLGALGIPFSTKLFFRGVEKPGGGFGYFGKHFLRKYGFQPDAEASLSE